MSERRKPSLTLLLRGTTQRSHKIELYKASEWNVQEDKYRMRINGRFYPYVESAHIFKFYSLEDIMKILEEEFRSYLIS